jgi:peptidoglycan/LPS O-acetylase OafA/YrhL
MLAAVMVMTTLDSTDETSKKDNLESVFHVVTYTWNWYVQGNLLTSRPDFGHLWYLSVDMQAFVIVAALLYMMRRRPVGVLFVLGGFLLLLTWWRFHVADTEFVFQVLVRTTARMDAFVVGALLGAALPLLRRAPLDPRWLRVTAWTTLLALVPLFAYCSTDDHFLGWGVTLLEVDLAVLLGAVALGAATPARPVVASRAPVWLGQRSLLIYIWHYPIFVFVERHTPDTTWQVRTVIAMTATAVIVLVCDRTVERRVSRALADPRWERLRDGVPAYVSRRLRERRDHDRSQQVTPDRS